MTIEKAIFYGFGAWVGRIDGETRCGFWPKHPAEVNFDPILLIPVDLSKTPTAAKKGKIDWDEIQVDDFKDGTPSGGVTTIGPMFPDGATTGVVYLEKSYYERLRPEIRPPIKPQASPQDNCGNNRLTAVVYGEAAGNPRAGLRYHAFLARIVSERKTSALVAARNHVDRPATGAQLRSRLGRVRRPPFERRSHRDRDRPGQTQERPPLRRARPGSGAGDRASEGSDPVRHELPAAPEPSPAHRVRRSADDRRAP